VLVQAWATRDDNGAVDVLVWNGTINAALTNGDTRLNRSVQVTITGLEGGSYHVRLARVDQKHSNVVAHCPADVEWPDEALWVQLRTRDELYEEDLPNITAKDGTARLDFALPLPGVARIRLSRGGRPATH
jgi:xylan 1,4-beta-xylosidase